MINKLINQYLTPTKYLLVSGSSFVVDIILFSFFIFLLSPFFGDEVIIVSTIVARIISSIFNYLLNKNVVFNNKTKTIFDKKSLIKYYILVVIQLSLSATLVFGIKIITDINPIIIKIPIDILIFIINYFIQKIYIFKKEA